MLYLIQHGEAKDANQDPQRDLTRTGERNARLAGAFLKRHRVTVGQVWHSGKLRAEHTARLVAAAIGCANAVFVHPGLFPGDDPAEIVTEIEAVEGDGLIIVGHLPFLPTLARTLLDGSALRFRNAGIAALSKADGGWLVDWVLPPELFEKESPK